MPQATIGAGLPAGLPAAAVAPMGMGVPSVALGAALGTQFVTGGWGGLGAAKAAQVQAAQAARAAQMAQWANSYAPTLPGAGGAPGFFPAEQAQAVQRTAAGAE